MVLRGAFLAGAFSATVAACAKAAGASAPAQRVAGAASTSLAAGAFSGALAWIATGEGLLALDVPLRADRVVTGAAGLALTGGFAGLGGWALAGLAGAAGAIAATGALEWRAWCSRMKSRTWG